ncbi:SRPBCC family protein [Promicromonospora sp. NPDC019610]|uniref:SRPBCC family protein n=1 Tax=Promicromonospora sp. NPDC019610 TaxID=3364405 RepID=UPI0037932BA1
MTGASEAGFGDAGPGGVGPRRYRDVHATTVGAPPEAVWPAVLDQVEVLGTPAWYVRLIGCRDRGPAGPRPLTAGSVVPGFRVRAADPPDRLVLDGVHRFSVYTLTFRLVPDAAGTRVEAHTDATFPGVLGAVYRLLVIDSGIHKIATRSIVTRVRRRVPVA